MLYPFCECETTSEVWNKVYTVGWDNFHIGAYLFMHEVSPHIYLGSCKG